MFELLEHEMTYFSEEFTIFFHTEIVILSLC